MQTHLSQYDSTTEGERTSSLSIYARSHMTIILNWDTRCNLQNNVDAMFKNHNRKPKPLPWCHCCQVVVEVLQNCPKFPAPTEPVGDNTPAWTEDSEIKRMTSR